MLVRRLSPLALLLTALADPLGAQTEPDLKRYFEGKRVTVRIDMPGTEQGVDVSPGPSVPWIIRGMPAG